MLRGTRYMAAQSGQPVGPPAGHTGQPAHAPSQDGACLSDPAFAFQDLYHQPSAEAGADFLKNCTATHCRLAPMIDAARTVKHHWDGILRWFHSRIANGLIEGINSLVQAAKAKARGLPLNPKPQGHQVHLLAGKLDLPLPA